jgi:hypothetical protein
VQKIYPLPGASFDCILIDPRHGGQLKRERLLGLILSKLSRNAVLILDNYAYHREFPESYRMTTKQFINRWLGDTWIGEEYNQEKWKGDGTRIFHQRSV